MSDLEKIKIPYVKKDVVLISPGVWNETNITPEAIENSMKDTVFDDRNTSVYLNHDDNEVDKWIGQVENIRVEDGVQKGDLVLVDKETAMKIEFGANFGISPKLNFVEGDRGDFSSFEVVNYSVVINPAIKDAYINENEVKSMSELEFKDWTTKYKNSLPDSSFLYIGPGGKKDSEGKTVPRNLRKLPYKDADGKVDVIHLKNALSRLGQEKTDIPEDVKKKLIAKAKKILEQSKFEDEVNDMTEEVTEKQFSEEVTESPETEKVEAEAPVEKVADEDASEDGEPEAAQESAEEKEKEDVEEKEFSDNGFEKVVVALEKWLSKIDNEKAVKKFSEAIELLKNEDVEFEEEPKEAPPKEDSAESSEEPSEEGSESEEKEEKVEEKFNKSDKELLALNEELLGALKETNEKLNLLEKVNDKLKDDLAKLEKELNTFKDVEESKRLEQFNEKLERVAGKYCSFFEVEEKDVEGVKKMLSTYSEELLENTEKYLVKKEQARAEVEPAVETEPSSQLNVVDTNSEEYARMSPKEKTEYLFKTFVENKQL